MHLKTIYSIIFTISLLFCCCSHAWAVLEINSDTPIHISADKMVSHEKEKAIIFTGHVKAKQGDLLINSEEMTVYRGGPKQKSAPVAGTATKESPQIQKIFATGNVEIIQQGFVATGDEVEYLATKEKIILTGNAKIVQDNNMVTGYQVEMDLATGTTTVTPEQGGKTTTDTAVKPKVEMYFYPKQNSSKPQPTQ
jgi:lipopolysaccharide export system protein LptA